ncbi:MAG: carboxypeptidase-like regulatory domain-containing protein [Deferribacteres bacterium]|nr:carboxypeptidase-like regulatory domain-containing protein [Deferribacteres bacterium]
MRFSIFLAILFFNLHNLSAQQLQRTISGTIVDISNNLPISDVNLFLQKQRIGVASDSSGKFQLHLSNAQDTLIVRHIAYFVKKIKIQAGSQNITLAVELHPKTLPMPEVGVQAEQVINDPQTFRLTGRFLQEIPDFSGETLTAVKTFPGVTSNNEMSNQFSAQGGSPDENLILLEDMTISRSQRIRSSSHENISPINRMLMQDMSFTAGAYPASYGERLSSLLITRYRTISSKKLTGEAEVGFLNISGMLAGQPDSSFYWAIAGRYANRKMVLGTLQTEGELLPRAHDFQAVLSYKPLSGIQLMLMGIRGKNQFESNPVSFVSHANIGLFQFNTYLTEYSGYENFNHTRSIGSAILRIRLHQKLSMQQSVSISHSDEVEDVDKKFETSVYLYSPTIGYTEEPQIVNDGLVRRLDVLVQRTTQTKTRITWQLSDSVGLDTGIEYEYNDYSDDLKEYQHESAANVPGAAALSGYTSSYVAHAQFDTRTIAGFGNLHLITRSFDVETGLRLSRYKPSDELIIKPRLIVTLKRSEFTRFQMAFGRYSQPAGYLERRTEEGRLLTNTPAQRSSNIVFGMQHFSDSGTEYQVQAFFKKLTHLIPYKTDDLFIRYQPDLHSEGEIYGASAYWKGQVTPSMTSWFSYTYLFGQQDISGEGKSRLPFDQRHTFTCVIQDNMPRFPNSKAHVRFLLGSGYPYTFEGILYNPETGRKEKLQGKRNALRLPFYRRVDIGFSYDFELQEQQKLRLSFDMFNIFDFRNILGYGLISNSLGHTEIYRYNLSRRFYSAKVNYIF